MRSIPLLSVLILGVALLWGSDVNAQCKSAIVQQQVVTAPVVYQPLQLVVPVQAVQTYQIVQPVVLQQAVVAHPVVIQQQKVIQQRVIQQRVFQPRQRVFSFNRSLTIVR